MPGQQRELQGPAGCATPAGLRVIGIKSIQNQGKFKTKTTEGEVTKYGAENRGKKEVNKTTAPLGRARPGAINERGG